MNVLKGGSINMVMACGMLCVLLVGSIDISVTAILAFAGAVCGKLMGLGVIQSTWMMFALGILIGAVIGAVNGVLMSYGKVIAIIVTLGTSYIVRALIPHGVAAGHEQGRSHGPDRGLQGQHGHQYVPRPSLPGVDGHHRHRAGRHLPQVYAHGPQPLRRRLQRRGGAGARRAHRAHQGAGARHLRRHRRPGGRDVAGLLLGHREGLRPTATRCSPSRPACWAASPSPAATARSPAWSSAR